MLHTLRSSTIGRSQAIRGLLLIVVVLVALGPVTAAQAHCDSRQGPVATAARNALETGDLSLVMPYVQADAEAELTAAFERALAVRSAGGEAQALADEYFQETAVRLHRQGEGASYTGLTDEATPSVIILADEAMAAGSLDGMYSYFDELTREGLAERYAEVLEAREHAEAEGTVRPIGSGWKRNWASSCMSTDCMKHCPVQQPMVRETRTRSNRGNASRTRQPGTALQPVFPASRFLVLSGVARLDAEPTLRALCS